MAKKIGYTKCEHCGNTEATVKETETGTLSVNCHHCDLSSFAKAGTKAARLIRSAMKPCDDEGAAPTPTPTPEVKQMSAFNPANLGA